MTTMEPAFSQHNGGGYTLKAFWLALLVAAPLYVFGTFNHDVWRPADAREAGIAREMIENGNWSATHLSGHIFLEKPPLYTWLLAAPMLVFGYREWALRIFVFLFTMGTLAAMYPLARQRLTPLGAQASLIALATTLLFLEVNHGAMIDNGLVFFILIAMLSFFIAMEQERPSRLYAALFYTSVGLTFLCKGAIGVVLIGAALCGYITTARLWKRFWKMYPLMGCVIVGILAGSWLLALWRAGGADYFHIFFYENHLKRFLGTFEPTKARWYYLPYLLLIALPWTLVIPCGIRTLWRRSRTDAGLRRYLLFLFWWIGAMFLVLNTAGAKGHQYLMPILPPLAVFAGAWVEKTINGGSLRKLEIYTTALFVVLVALSGIAFTLAPLFLDSGKRFGGILLTIAMAAAGFTAVRALPRRNWRQIWRALAAIAILGGLTMGWSVEGIMNRHKSMKELNLLLDQHLPEDAQLWGYDLNENTQGSLIFYGHPPLRLPDLRQADNLEKETAYILLVSGHRRDDPVDYGNILTNWKLLFHEHIGGRHCCLYTK